jgi:hypothetical protein
LRQTVKSGLEALDRSGRGHYHRHEPEARRMQCDGKNRFGYNAQAVIDSHSGIAVAVEVTHQENDGPRVDCRTRARNGICFAARSIRASS